MWFCVNRYLWLTSPPFLEINFNNDLIPQVAGSLGTTISDQGSATVGVVEEEEVAPLRMTPTQGGEEEMVEALFTWSWTTWHCTGGLTSTVKTLNIICHSVERIIT